MKHTFTILALALSLSAGVSARADEARLLRFPATNGTEVAFSYAGDLWTVPVQGGGQRKDGKRMLHIRCLWYSFTNIRKKKDFRHLIAPDPLDLPLLPLQVLQVQRPV